MSEKEIKMVKNIWWSVHKEDHEMCERLQEGRYSPASYEGGLFNNNYTIFNCFTFIITIT